MKKFYLLALLFGVLQAYAQNAIKFPYTQGIHTYLKTDSWQSYFNECKNNDFNYIEVQPEGYGFGNQQQIVAGCTDTKKWIEENGLKVWSIHLPYGNSFDISTTDEAKRQKIVAELELYIRTLTEVYHPHAMVLHPSGEPIVTDARRADCLAQSAKSVAELCKVTDELGVVLCVENLPRTCLGSTPEEMLQIVEPTKNARICFDTNHFLKGTHYEFLRKVGHLVATVHISDYDYTNEKHLLPGFGKLPWGDLLLTLEECGYNGVMMSESDKNATGYTNPTETKQVFDRIVKEYEAVKANASARARLVLDDLIAFYCKGEQPEEVFIAGNEPGNYPKEKVDAFMKVYNEALSSVEANTMTHESVKTMREQLIAQFHELLQSVNPITDGYYCIVSAHEGFKAAGKKMAMYSDADNILKWKAYEPSLNFVFEIKSTGEGVYSIRNMANQAFIGNQSSYSTPVPVTATHQVDQCIESLGKGTVKIFNVETDVAYHTESHREGAGSAGNIVIWNSSPIEGSGSSWVLEKVDTDLSSIIDIPQSGYTTFYSDRSIVLPEQVSAGVVTGIDAASRTVVMDWKYLPHDVVPAGTGVVLRGKSGKFFYTLSDEAAERPQQNLLKGSVEAGPTTGDGVRFYVLTEGERGAQFAWGNADGAAFDNEAYKAYLTIPQAESENLPALLFYNSAREYPRFVVMSDIHVGADGADHKVPEAWKNLIENKPALDAIFICGDLTNGGTASQYQELKGMLADKNVLPANLPIYLLMGNHDNYGDPAGTFYKELGQPLHQFIDIKGYPFITISTRGTANSGLSNHNEEAYRFLIEKLAEAAKTYPGKPIFVFTHIPPENTVYGSESWGNARLTEIMSAYPQVIAFSGHTHYPIGDPRSISQTSFTAINDGSTTYAELDKGEVSGGTCPPGYDEVTEAAIVNIDAAGNVVIERWNTADNEEILPKWEINAPHDGKNFVYAHRDGGESPVFPTDAYVNVDTGVEACEVTFTQGSDDDVVLKYRVEIVDNEAVITSYDIFSGHFLNSRKPDTLKVSFDGLPGEKELFARIFAVDSYGKESAPLASAKFTVDAYKPAEGTSAPVADLLDVAFESDSHVYDKSDMANEVAYSSERPTTYYDENYHRNGAAFTGSYYCYYKVDYKNNDIIKNAFRNAFTLELLYCPQTTDHTYDPFSSTENGGAGLEQDGTDISLWCWVGGKYQTVTATNAIKAGEWYHVIATYDKEEEYIKLYINGKLADKLHVPGQLELSSNKDAQWIGIGGDACGSDWAQGPFEGKILVARMYGKAVSRDEVYWMKKNINDWVTGINSMVRADGRQDCYDLSGRRVNAPNKGLYIIDGKRIVVK